MNFMIVTDLDYDYDLIHYNQFAGDYEIKQIQKELQKDESEVHELVD